MILCFAPPFPPPLEHQDGEADIGSLAEFCEANMLKGAAQWQAVLRPMGRCMKVERLLLRLVSEGASPSLCSQLCIWIAGELEDKLVNTQAEGPKQSSSPVKEIGADVSRTAYKISARLAKYVYSTRTFVENSGPLSFLSISTDKSSVGGLPLQNSFVQVNGSPVVFTALSQAHCGCVLGEGNQNVFGPVRVIVFSLFCAEFG